MNLDVVKDTSVAVEGEFHSNLAAEKMVNQTVPAGRRLLDLANSHCDSMSEGGSDVEVIHHSFHGIAQFSQVPVVTAKVNANVNPSLDINPLQLPPFNFIGSPKPKRITYNDAQKHAGKSELSNLIKKQSTKLRGRERSFEVQEKAKDDRLKTKKEKLGAKLAQKLAHGSVLLTLHQRRMLLELIRSIGTIQFCLSQKKGNNFRPLKAVTADGNANISNSQVIQCLMKELSGGTVGLVRTLQYNENERVFANKESFFCVPKAVNPSQTKHTNQDKIVCTPKPTKPPLIKHNNAGRYVWYAKHVNPRHVKHTNREKYVWISKAVKPHLKHPICNTKSLNPGQVKIGNEGRLIPTEKPHHIKEILAREQYTSEIRSASNVGVPSCETIPNKTQSQVTLETVPCNSSVSEKESSLTQLTPHKSLQIDTKFVVRLPLFNTPHEEIDFMSTHIKKTESNSVFRGADGLGLPHVIEQQFPQLVTDLDLNSNLDSNINDPNGPSSFESELHNEYEQWYTGQPLCTYNSNVRESSPFLPHGARYSGIGFKQTMPPFECQMRDTDSFCRPIHEPEVYDSRFCRQVSRSRSKTHLNETKFPDTTTPQALDSLYNDTIAPECLGQPITPELCGKYGNSYKSSSIISSPHMPSDISCRITSPLVTSESSQKNLSPFACKNEYSHGVCLCIDHDPSCRISNLPKVCNRFHRISSPYRNCDSSRNISSLSRDGDCYQRNSSPLRDCDCSRRNLSPLVGHDWSLRNTSQLVGHDWSLRNTSPLTDRDWSLRNTSPLSVRDCLRRNPRPLLDYDWSRRKLSPCEDHDRSWKTLSSHRDRVRDQRTRNLHRDRNIARRTSSTHLDRNRAHRTSSCHTDRDRSLSTSSRHTYDDRSRRISSLRVDRDRSSRLLSPSRDRDRSRRKPSLQRDLERTRRMLSPYGDCNSSHEVSSRGRENDSSNKILSHGELEKQFVRSRSPSNHRDNC